MSNENTMIGLMRPLMKPLIVHFTFLTLLTLNPNDNPGEVQQIKQVHKRNSVDAIFS